MAPPSALASSPPRVADLASLVAALGRHEIDPSLLASSRARAAEPRIDYPLGSGEAEQVALFAGLKPLVRQIVPAAEVAGVEARLRPLGLSVVVAAESLATAASGAAVLFVGRDRARAVEAARLEGEEGHDLQMARLLGYPRCCAEAYLEEPLPRGNIAVLRSSLGRTAPGRPAPRLNCLDWGVFHYVAWLPCSFACQPSLAYADAVASQITRRHGQWLTGRRAACPPGCRHERFVREIDRALSASRLVATERVQVSIEGRIEQGRLRVERAWPTLSDRHPGSGAQGQGGEGGQGSEERQKSEEREASARLAALCEQAGSVAVEGEVVVAGSTPLFSSAEALLVPFGAGASAG